MIKNKDKIKNLMLEDLEKSGINNKDAILLGIEPISKSEMMELSNGKIKYPAYCIPYTNFNGEPIGFYRFKILDPESKIKYWQPKGTHPHLYIPNNISRKKKITDLYIIEGEKKAACACKYGLHAVAVPGVDCFHYAKSDELIEGFNQFIFEGVRVNVVYDADTNANEHVQKSILTLSTKLMMRGALCYQIKLPAGLKKCGVDDYIVEHGIAKFKSLPKQLLRIKDYINMLRDPAVRITNKQKIISVTILNDLNIKGRFFYGK